MKIYLAPLEGITTYIFRNAFEKYYGGVDKYFTPFLTASHLKGRELRDVAPDNNHVEKLVPQILTNDSWLFLEITRQLAELGYREVNLNLGCPSGTVVAKGRGAGFLDRTEELERFLYEVYSGLENISLPQDSVQGLEQNSIQELQQNPVQGLQQNPVQGLHQNPVQKLQQKSIQILNQNSGKKGNVSQGMKVSVKTRLGMEFLSEWDDILEIYSKFPISELIIHPRLREEYYSGEIHMDRFAESFDVIPATTPICYNGDITSVDTFYEKDVMVKALSNDQGYEEALMIGRGALMNPELLGNIRKLSDKNELDLSISSDKNQSRKGVNSDELGSHMSFISGAETYPATDNISDIGLFKKFITEIMNDYLEEMSHEKQVVMKMKELWTYFSKGLGLSKKQLKEIYKVSRLSEYKSAVQMVLSQVGE